MFVLNRQKFPVFNRATEPETPTWCPLCKCVMSSIVDAEAYARMKCCRSCETDIAELNMIAWKDGWRPDAEVVNKVIERRSELIRSLYYLKIGRSNGP
jgi:hypothetical protein